MMSVIPFLLVLLQSPSLPATADGDDEVIELVTADEGLAQNLRFQFDLFANAVHDVDSGTTGFLSSYGVDMHKVFTRDGRDVGTLLIQSAFLRADGLPVTPGLFDDAHDWEILFRNMWFNYTRWAPKGVSVRVGHFEYPYGLEWDEDTNGTLRQFTSAQNLGLKADWGIGLNGWAKNLEYEVALFRGSGNEIHREGGNFAVAGRVGTPREENSVYGLSAYRSRLPSKGGLVDRTRLGFDATFVGPASTILMEANIGETEGRKGWLGMAELFRTSSDSRNSLYGRIEATGTDVDGSGWDSTFRGLLGGIYSVSTRSQVSAQWAHEFEGLAGAEEKDTLQVQFRIWL
jgi:hypothetical protein